MKQPHRSTDHQQPGKEEPIVSLWLDSYDDLFSDFDPRPYEHRAISDDFVIQVRKLSRGIAGRVAILRLLLPEGKRNETREQAIRKKIEDHFSAADFQLTHAAQVSRRKGVLFVAAGLALMAAAGYISFLNFSTIVAHLLKVLFEPGGWFLFWTGLDQLLNVNQKKGDLHFFQRMALAHIEFGTFKQ